MNYEEFKDLEEIFDSKFVKGFRYPNGETFYIEPAFYTQLIGFKEKREEDYPRIINRMIEVVRKNKRVVFTSEYESPQTEVEGYIYLESTSIIKFI